MYISASIFGTIFFLNILESNTLISKKFLHTENSKILVRVPFFYFNFYWQFQLGLFPYPLIKIINARMFEISLIFCFVVRYFWIILIPHTLLSFHPPSKTNSSAEKKRTSNSNPRFAGESREQQPSLQKARKVPGKRWRWPQKQSHRSKRRRWKKNEKDWR